MKIGLVKPGARAGKENVSFWRAHAPVGVEIEATDLGYSRSDKETFAAGWDRAEELATALATRGCALVVVSGTPPFLLVGLATERRWRTELSQQIGVPVVTAMEAHAISLRALGARVVAVATYYGPELNDALARYLQAFGLETELLGGFRLTGQDEGLFSTPMHAQAEISSEDVYDYCIGGVEEHARDADTLYINGAGWDVAPIISRLEDDLDVDVVWGPVGEMWLSYSILRIKNAQPDCGRLLREEVMAPRKPLG